MTDVRRFALLGAAGYVAPRHMEAIKATGNDLLTACDTHDGVGVLDRYFPQCRFFTEVERFDRHLEKLRRRDTPVEFVSICTPNYLHDAHCRLALRVRADAICEKPLVINPWNLDQLAQLEEEHERRIYTILQLRLHPELLRLKKELSGVTGRLPVDLTYVTHRGPWYQRSWKGDPKRSGTLAMNIGVHFFDALPWIFGPVAGYRVDRREENILSGRLFLERADVTWLLSTSLENVPDERRTAGHRVYRALQMGDQVFDFSTGFEDLHTRSYEEIIAGNGFGVDDARTSIDLVYRLRTCALAKDHPFV